MGKNKAAVKLLFTRRRNIGSAVIRATTWSGWSHVDVIDDRSVLGAVAFRGVERERLSTRLAHASRAAVMTIPCRNAQAVINAAAAQIGKPYDYIGVLGIYLHRAWQEQDRWFCSELIANAFDEAGLPLFRSTALHRITPQHLWMLPYGVRVIKTPKTLQAA